MMREFGAVVGKRPRIIPVPVLSPGLSALLAVADHDGAGQHRARADRRAQARHPGRRRGLAQLVPQRLLGFREAVQAALKAEREHAVAARWTEGRLMFRGNRPDYSFYAKRAGASAVSSARPESLWKVVTAIGGDNRYYTLNWLWWLREAIDWLVGGPGFTRGRRDPADRCASATRSITGR